MRQLASWTPSPIGLGVLDLDDLPAGIMPAVRANMVGQMLLAAIGTGEQLPVAQGIVSSPAVASSLGEFSLRQRRHKIPRVVIQKIACPMGRRVHYIVAKRAVKAHAFGETHREFKRHIRYNSGRDPEPYRQPWASAHGGRGR